MKIEAGMKCKQTNVLGNFDYVGEEFEITEVNNDVVIVKCYGRGVGFGIEHGKFEEYFEFVNDGIEENSKKEIKEDVKENGKGLNLNDIKIGEKYRVIKNRYSFFGDCRDIIEIEGQEVEVFGIDGEDFNIKDLKNKAHMCRVENLEEIEKIDNK